MASIEVSDQTKMELDRIRGWLMYEDGKKLSYSKLLSQLTEFWRDNYERKRKKT